MGVRILKRSYTNAFAPPTETKPDWLIGNTGDWLRLNLEVEAGVDYLATQSQPISVNQEERTIKLMNGKKWSDYGFDLGADVTLTFKKDDGTISTITINLVIEQLFNDTLVYQENNDMDQVPFETIPTDRGSIRIFSVKLFDERLVQGVRMKYANVDNAQVSSHILTSFIDATETEMMYNGLNALTESMGFKDMLLIGNQSGMSINSARIRKIETQDAEPIQIIQNINQPVYVLGTSQPNVMIPNYKIIREAWAFPINMVNSVSNYQSLTDANLLVNISDLMPNSGNYGVGQYTRCFYLNSPDVHTVKFNFDVKFSIVNTNKNDPNCYIRLVLIKYTNGDDLLFGEVQELKRWDDGEFPNGLVLNYQDIITKDLNIGDSLCLAIEWNHDALNQTNRFINPKIIDLNIDVEDLGNPIEGYKKNYEIEVDFMLSSFFEQITDLETGTPPQVLFDANSLADVIKLTFLPEWNNPNIKIENNMSETERFGNTGWFNENYNQLENNFQVKSVQYFDMGGQIASTLSYGSEIKVKAVIGGVGNLSPDSDFKHGFIWLPIDETQYKEKLTPFHKNTKISSHFDTTAFNANVLYPFVYEGYATDEAKMNTRAISYMIQGDDLVFEAIFSPTVDFMTFFQDKIEDRKFAIWVSVADRTLETNFSDRVSLLLDVKDMDLFIPISGELEGVINKFIEHPEDHLVPGIDLYNGFLEDDILARSFFSIDKGKRLNQIIMGYEVENIISGETYELERYNANLQNFVSTPQGVHEINFNAIRGYKLAPNNNKNWVKIIRNEDGDTNLKCAYQLLFGQKIRWEYWLQRANVPTEYFNNTQEFNGSNNDWLHFLRTSNSHKVNFFILFDISDNETTKRLKNTFPITFNGYDENEGITTEHKYYDNETNTLLNIGTDAETGRPLGVILSNKNTRIEIIYTKLSDEWNINNIYAVTTIEIDKGAGQMTHRQLSSITNSENDNILIPLASETKLKVEQISATVIKTSCLVDFTKLENATRYKITGRIGCFANENGTPIPTRIYDENNYEPNYQ